MLELALLSPGLLFLFSAALDWGFFAYALISVENAARTAALYASSSASTASATSGACNLALSELRRLPNVGAGVVTCTGTPASVVAIAVSGPDGGAAARVNITYTTVRLIPLPGLLRGQLTINREVTMRLRA
jgi:hypothetical protein